MMYRTGWAVLLGLLLLSGCAEPPSVVAGKPAEAARLGNDVVAEPAWVLDGTDVLPLADVRRAALPLSPAGDYQAEPGGSEITVSITGAADGAWAVMRVYREPGLPPHTKRYQTERSGQLLVSPGDGLTIQGTEEGVLMLELESGVESIPADFWIHYIRVGKGS